MPLGCLQGGQRRFAPGPLPGEYGTSMTVRRLASGGVDSSAFLSHRSRLTCESNKEDKIDEDPATFPDRSVQAPDVSVEANAEQAPMDGGFGEPPAFQLCLRVIRSLQFGETALFFAVKVCTRYQKPRTVNVGIVGQRD